MDYSKKYQKYLHKLQLAGAYETPEQSTLNEWRLAVNELSPENQLIVRPLIRDLHRRGRLIINYDPEDLQSLDWFIENAREELARPDTPEQEVENEDVAAARLAELQLQLAQEDALENARAEGTGTPVVPRAPVEQVLLEPDRLPEVLPEAPGDLTTFASRLQCMVCLTNAVNTRLNPCGHLLCSKCFVNLKVPKTCPSCRTPIQEGENIFYGGLVSK
jgi:hypothetical protein